MASEHEIMKRNLGDEVEFNDDDDDDGDDSEYEGETYENQSKPKVSMARKAGNTSKDYSKEKEYGNEDKQEEQDLSPSSTKSRSKAPGMFRGYLRKLKSDPNKKLLARIEDLENQVTVAKSKLAQKELEMSNETNAAIKERDELQTELETLRLTYEDLKTQFENVGLENEKERQNAHSGFEMKRPRGWLWKRGVHGPTGRIWRHRWFKAKRDGMLYYYKRKKIFRGSIEIDKITDVQNLPSSEQNEENSCFNIVTPSRTYEIKAKDEDEKLRWTKALDDLIYWRNRQVSCN